MSDVDEFLETPTAVHLAILSGRIDNLGTSQAHNGQLLESLSADVRVLTERSSQSIGHHESIRRIWERMEKNQKAIDEIGLRQNSMRNLAIGAIAVSGILVGILGWIGNDQISTIKETARELRAESRRADERMDRVEIYLAGSKDQEYQR